MKSSHLCIGLLGVVIGIACRREPAHLPQSADSIEPESRELGHGAIERGRSVIAEFNDSISRKGQITFRSWDGKWIGMDGDTVLHFLSGGGVDMDECGESVQVYQGTYRINGRGEIVATFTGYGHPWPVMLLGRDTKSMLLQPSDGRMGLESGNRGGYTIPAGAGSYWPFRPVPENDPQNRR